MKTKRTKKASKTKPKLHRGLPAKSKQRRRRAATTRPVVKRSTSSALALPDLQTVEGFVARVLIGEPSFKNSVHGWPEQRRCMTALAALLYNRVKAIPAKYTQKEIAAVTTTDYREILAATNQFDGFGKDAQGKYTLRAAYAKIVQARVDLANQGTPGNVYETVSHALTLATALADGSFDAALDPFSGVTKVGSDKTTGRGYYMRTEGTGSPTPVARAVPVADGGNLAGNTFFTLLVKA